MAENTVTRDDSGRFTEQIPIDDARVSMTDFKAARAEHKDTVSLEDLEKPTELTGDESMEDFKAKREEQQGRGGKGGGFQKRIDRLVKDRAQLRERLARYEPTEQANGHAAETVESSAFRQIAERKANSNGAAPQERESAPAESQPERKTAETGEEEPKIRAMRERYPDWDGVMTRAQNEKMRISDEAAAVMHASPNAGHIIYMLASSDEMRSELNKLSPAQQVQEMRRLDGGIEAMESGQTSFAERVKTTLSKEELAETRQAVKQNSLGSRVVFSLMKELNQLPNMPQVFKALITNPETCQRLAAMSQTGATLELGRISARLERNGPREFVSHAPPPIKPVGNGSTASSVPMDAMDMGSYKAARAAGRVR